MSKLITFGLGLLLVSFFTSAQIEQVGRLEFELTELQEKFKVIGLNENGVMMYRQVSAEQDDRIELIKVDTTMKVIWSVYFPIKKNLILIKPQYHNGALYFLLRNRALVGGDFQIATIDVQTGNFISHTVKNVIPFNPIEFELAGNTAYMAGYFNYRPIVVGYNFQNQGSRILPGFFNEPGEIDQLKAFEDGSIDIVVSGRNIEKKRCLWIRNYNAQGDLIKTTILQPEKGKSLIFGHSIMLDNGDQIVAGVYGRFSLADYSRGIFVARVNPMGEYAIQYYNFAQLDNFFSYMKAKKQKRIKGRIERKTIHGKKIKFNYRLIIHDIIPYKNQYIMTGEAFYPVYIYPSPYATMRSYSFYNTTPTQSGLYGQRRTDVVFDGYRYTHAVAIGFDKNGKLAWDNSFEINDIKSMELEQFVKVKPEQDRILMMYQFTSTLRSKIIKDSEVLEGKINEPVKSSFEHDGAKVTMTENEALDRWYKDYFYSFGIQTLQWKSKGTKRIVFLNKVRYK